MWLWLWRLLCAASVPAFMLQHQSLHDLRADGRIGKQQMIDMSGHLGGHQRMGRFAQGADSGATRAVLQMGAAVVDEVCKHVAWMVRILAFMRARFLVLAGGNEGWLQ
jgi:hypothetical protein